YAAVLRQLLHQLVKQHGRAEMAGLLQAVGRDLATVVGGTVGGESPRQRAEAVAQVLGELGGLAEVRSDNGSVFLEGRSCPLGAIVGDYPEACQLALALVRALVGTEAVEERCIRVPEPRCIFKIDAPASTES